MRYIKILYLTKGDHVDYQNDCVLIGLKEILGENVIDINKQQHIYNEFDENQALKMYGKGMSVTRAIPDIEVDRTDITNKIKNRFFDFIVYGSIWRCSENINDILKYYSPHEIIAIDGEDEINIHPTYDLGIKYFKRELINSMKNIFPISFAIPRNKINFITDKKTRCVAICDPRDRSTYIYNDEKSYYRGYQEALFAYTMKKAGWDCMRHYEIISNGCIPIFFNIEQCPQNTMVNFPKKLCLDVYNELKIKKPLDVYSMFIDEFKQAIESQLNTSALARYFIDQINK